MPSLWSDTSTPGLRNNLLAIQSDIPFSVKATPGMKAMRVALHKYAPMVLTSPSFGETIVFQGNQVNFSLRLSRPLT